MWSRAKGRVGFAMVAGATVVGCLALVGGPAYGQAQSSGVGNNGQASASSGGNSSAGNSSSNSAADTSTQTTPPTTSPSVLGGVLGLVLNLTGTTTNTSNGTSAVSTGGAQAAGNDSSTSAGQTSTGATGTVFSPFLGTAVPGQSSGVTNSGTSNATTGGNQSVGNNSTNTAANTSTVSGGLIAIGLTLGQTASNVSNGTSAITTGPASASGNQSTTSVGQAATGNGLSPFTVFGVGGGVACSGFFNSGQSSGVNNSGSANASTGNNASVGNQSQNAAVTNSNGDLGGLVSASVPGLLNDTAGNVSDGTSAINTGAATAAGNQSTTQVSQNCLDPVRTTSQIIPGSAIPLVQAINTTATTTVARQLAFTGHDPFVMVLIAFSLLFGGLLFLVWEKVESYPLGPSGPAGIA